MAVCHARALRQWAMMLAAAALLVAALGAREAQHLSIHEGSQPPSGHVAAVEEGHPPTASFVSGKQRSLITYYWHATSPSIQLLPRAAGARPGRTPLRVVFPGPSSVSKYMPVVLPTVKGMIHEVADTWRTLQAYVRIFAHLQGVNVEQAATGAPRLFPRPGVAIAAASADCGGGSNDNVAHSVAAAVDTYVNNAEARGARAAWTETSPGSVLLQLVGRGLGAVADVMDATQDASTGAITLDMEVVHAPDTISEFSVHAKQSLDPSHAHYHFHTPADVHVDADDLLAALAEARYKVTGLHVFAKGFASCSLGQLSVITPSDAPSGSITVRADWDFSPPIQQYCPSPTKVPGEQRGSNATEQRDGSCYPITVVWRWSLTSTTTLDVLSTNCDLVTDTQPAPRQGGGSAKAGAPPVLAPQDTSETVTGSSIVYGTTGTAGIQFTRPTTGCLSVELAETRFDGTREVVNVPADGLYFGPGCPVTAALVLTPTEARRHVGQRIVVTIIALDAANKPLAGATVSVAVVGYCLDLARPMVTVITDAAGRASVSLKARRPGVAVVVAATQSASGQRVVSNPARIMFGDDDNDNEGHRYGGRGRDEDDEDREERSYYSRGAQRWSADDDDHAATMFAAPDDGGYGGTNEAEAEHLEAEATRLVLARLPDQA